MTALNYNKKESYVYSSNMIYLQAAKQCKVKHFTLKPHLVFEVESNFGITPMKPWRQAFLMSS